MKKNGTDKNYSHGGGNKRIISIVLQKKYRAEVIGIIQD